MLDPLLARAESDDNVVGVAVFGSRAYGLHLHQRSDWDVLVAVHELTNDYSSERGESIEIAQLSLARVADPPDWFRPALLHADVRLDKTGEVTEAIRTATTVDPATAGEPLDGYINMAYRSAKNARAGLRLAALLDAQESVPWYLQFVFAVNGRVRPYNKWLEWELAEHPLPASNSLQLALVERIARTGDVAAQQELFRDVERIARDAGLGAAVDGWEPDVAFLRGTS
jgi:predicted nucleotidyltransferase